MSIKVVILWIGIFLVAIGLRFWQLGSVPGSLYWDEAAMLVEAKAVAKTGLDMHFRPWFQVMYPSYGDYKLPLYIWLASAAVSSFGVSEWSLRLPSAVIGVVSVGIAGMLAAGLLGVASVITPAQITSTQKTKSSLGSKPMIASLAMAVMAITPWSIMFSRTGFEGHLGQAFLGLAAFCLVASWRWPRWKWWWLAASAGWGAVATYAYFSVRFVWPLVLLVGQVLHSLSQPASNKNASENDHFNKEVSFFKQIYSLLGWGVVKVIWPLGLYGLLLIPQLTSPLYEESNRFRLGADSILQNQTEIITSNTYRQLAENTLIDRAVFHRYWLTTRQLLGNYSDHLSLSYLFLWGDPNPRHNTGYQGEFLATLLPAFLLGWYWWWRRANWVAFWLLWWWLAALLPASVPNTTPHALRSLNALLPLTVVMAGGLMAAFEWCFSNRSATIKSWLRFSLGLAWIGLILLNVVAWSYDYFMVYPVRSAEAWQAGYREIAQTVLAKRDQQPVFIQPFDDRLFLWFMIYGPYSGKEFATWPSAQYKKPEFDGIYFQNWPPATQLQNHQAIWVVGLLDAINHLQSEFTFTIEEQYPILDQTGDHRYTLWKIK